MTITTEQQHTRYDLIIVGGALVGASLALALKHLPLKIAIIEAIPPQERLSENFDARSIALSHSSQRILASLDVWDALGPHALPIEDIHVSNRGHFGATRLSAAKADLNAMGYVIEMQYLTQCLQSHCALAKNIDYYSPARVLDIIEINHERLLRVAMNDETVEFQTPLLIAADGGNSMIRQFTGLTSKTTDYQQTAIVANIGLARDHKNIAYERFTKQGPIALLPLTRQRAALVWVVPPEAHKFLLDCQDDDFLTQLQDAFGYRMGRFNKVGKRMAFPLKLQVVEQQALHGLVIVGNAAHNLHPIAGQGFNLSLRDIASLAQVLQEACLTQKNLGELATLQSYVDWRSRDQKATIALTNNLLQVFCNESSPRAFLGDIALLAIDNLPPLKNTLMQRAMGYANQLPDLACGIPLGK